MGSRERLVEAAVSRGRRQGFHGTRMQDVLADAGALAGSAYHYFPGGKEELIAAAVSQAGAVMDAALRGWLAGGVTVADAFAALVELSTASLASSDWADGCPVGTPATDSTNQVHVRESAATAFAAWRSTLAAALRDEGHQDPDAAALSLLALYEGALLLARVTRSPDPMEATVAVAAAIAPPPDR